MCKLIKAEFYRMTHSGIYFFLLLLVSTFPILFSITSLYNIENESLLAYVSIYCEAAGFMIPAFLGVIISATLCNMYQNRIYYYELMNGENTHKIILSKLAVYNIISIVFVIIPAIIFIAVLGADAPAGSMENVGLTIFLGCIAVFNVTCTTIFISMIVRHILGASMLFYMFNMGIMTVSTFTIEIAYDGDVSKTIKTINKILEFFPSIQLTKLAQPEYSDSFILKVILGFVVTFTALYSLTYISYKKKNFR